MRNPDTFGTAEDEVVFEPQSAAPPATTRRQGDAFHSAIHSNGQQGEKVRSNHGKFDINRLKRKLGNSNYAKPETRVSPSAMTDRQQDRVQQEHRQTKCRSMKNVHRHRLTQTPYEEVQDQYLEKHKPGTCDPTAPGRPGVFEKFGSGIYDQEPTMQTQATVPTIRHQGFRLKASTGSSEFDQHFGSQLERFLATLMWADHRIVGATAGHRIQVADCTLADAGASMIEGCTTEIYNRLFAILSWEDHWEIRFRELEGFVDQHGRLPLRKCESHSERVLGRWLHNQNVAFRKQKLPLHSFQKLLSASSPLIRRRVEGWQMGADGLFMQRCYELGEYVQLHHKVPDLANHRVGSSPWNLAKWLANLRAGNIRLSAGRMNMLQKVHPLVKAELQKWQNAPRLQQSKWEWKFGQLSRFVLATGAPPKKWGKKQGGKRLV